MILEYYNISISVDEINEILSVGRDGVKFDQIQNLLESYGGETKVYECNLNGMTKLKPPLILTWEKNHYVVLERIKHNCVIIVDPSVGKVKYSFSEFQEKFTGYALKSILHKKNRSVNIKESWISQLISENKKDIFKILLISFVVYIVMLSIPTFIRKIIDYPNRRDKTFLYLVLGLLIYILLNGYMEFKKIIISHIAYKNVQYKAINKVFAIPYKYFDIHSEGDVLFKLNCTQLVEHIFTKQLFSIIFESCIIIFLIIYLLVINFKMALIMLSFLIPTIFCLLVLTKKINNINGIIIQKGNLLNEIVVDVIANIEGIKLAGIESSTKQNWRDQFNNNLNSKMQYDKAIGIYHVLVNTFQLFFPLLILMFALFKQKQLKISTGEIISFYSMISIIFISISQTLININEIFVNSKYYDRLEAFLNAKEEDKKHSKIYFSDSINIKLEKVSFKFGKYSKFVLQHLNLNIMSGHTVAFVGESGAGKSTVGKLISGLYHCTEGRILINGIDINELDLIHYRKHIGVVTQNIFLQNKSIYQNIILEDEKYSEKEVLNVCKKVGLYKDILDMPMGLNTIVGSRGMNLSGGQRQKIALARAIIKKPSLLILDEATSHMDGINEGIVTKMLKEIKCTKIIMAHRLSTIYDADIIYVLENGKIVEFGKHEDLIKNKRNYFRLYLSQYDLV